MKRLHLVVALGIALYFLARAGAALTGLDGRMYGTENSAWSRDRFRNLVACMVTQKSPETCDQKPVNFLCSTDGNWGDIGRVANDYASKSGLDVRIPPNKHPFQDISAAIIVYVDGSWKSAYGATSDFVLQPGPCKMIYHAPRS